jgi:hypothetical protein
MSVIVGFALICLGVVLGIFIASLCHVAAQDRRD